MKIERDDFDAWRDNPITQHVFACVKKMSAEAREKWVNLSWGNGNSDPLMLADLRATSRICDDLIELSYEDIEDEESEWHKPERGVSHRVQGADKAEGD